MKIKTIALFLLSGLLAACTVATPFTLPAATTTLTSSPHPGPTHLPALTSTNETPPTLVPALTSTPTSGPVLKRIAQAGGSINGITVVGDLAYVGMGPRVGVIDVSRHESPRFVRQSEPLPGLVTRLLQISANFLLVSAGKYLVLMEISEPGELKPLQQLALEGGISAMVWDSRASILYIGGAIYVSPGSLGYDGFIAAIAFNSNSMLALQDYVTIPEIPLSLALGEDSLFAGANGEEGGLYQIQVESSGDLSTPKRVIASTPVMPLVPSSMRVIGERLYLGHWGVEAYDISNPEQPVKIWAGSVSGLNIARDFSIAGDQVFVTGFSIREPDIPVFGTFTAPDSIQGSPIGEVASITAMHDGDFVVADQSLNIFKSTDPQGLQPVGRYLPPVTNAIQAVANEEAVYVVDNGVGDGQSNSVLWVLSLPSLQPIGHVTTEFPNSWWEGIRTIALEGDRVYLATKDTIWVYGIDNPQPILLGKVGIEGDELEAISALRLGEKRLLITLQLTGDKYNVLRVYNLADLQEPATLGDPLTLEQGWGAQMTWTGSAFYIFLETSYFTKDDRLYAVSFHDDILETRGSVALAGYGDHMAADDNLFLLAGTSTSMDRSTLSVVKSETLKFSSTLTLPEDGVGIALVGDRALVVVGSSWDWGGEAQLLMVDLRDPLNPLQLDGMDIAYSHNNDVPILYASPYVILVNGAAGVEVLEYSH